MQRVRYHAYGGPDVLTVEEAAAPDPGPGQVRIRAEAVGCNFVDTQIRKGPGPDSLFHRPLPGRLTGDVVGTVEAVGPGVDTALTGRRVAALVAEDAYAESALADAEWLAAVPDGMDAAVATALPTVGPVALGILRAGRLAAGETVLVHAAAGGIGHLAVQTARLRGAGTVIAGASTPEKGTFAQDLGADAAVDTSAEDWPEQVRAIAPGGVDVVLDSGGGEMVLRGFEVLAPFGRLVTYGAAGGVPGDVPLTRIFGLVTMAGFALLPFRAADPAGARQDVEDITRWLAEGRLRYGIHARLPLVQAAQAHRILDSRAHRGRVVLLP